MPEIDRTRVLKQSLIFSGLEDRDIRELAGLCREKRLGAGEFAFMEGDRPEWFYLVASGKIKARSRLHQAARTL